MFKKLLYFFAVLVSIANTSQSQITSYNFRATTGGASAYVSITGTTATQTVSCSPVPGDESFANALPLGFTFRFNGVDYTSINASSNGMATFGAAFTGGASGTACNYDNTDGLATFSGSRPILAPFWDDLEVTGGINYSTTGFAPLRVFTLQYSNAKWDYSAAAASLSFQIKLYESSNIVEFIYRQQAGTPANASSGATIGIAGVATGSGNFLSLATAGTAPTVSSTVHTNNIGARPATGQIYAFDPIYCSAGGAYVAPGGEKISNVLFGAINNSSTSTAQYENFTPISTSAQPGTTENLSVTLSNSYSGDKVFVFIDYNRDGDFTDAGELVYTSPTGAGPFLNIPIAIPASAPIGLTRMRIRVDDTGGAPFLGSNPCGMSEWGQVEDYSVNIQNCVAAAVSVQPANTSGCIGGNATIGLTASGNGITYQWQVSTDNGVTYTNLTNAPPYSNVTTNTLTITGITASLNNYLYRVSFGGTCTPTGVVSNAATLTVNTPATVTAPVSAAACSGGNATFSVTATGTAPTYQWQVSTDNGATYTNVTNGGVYSGATTNMLIITGAPSSMNGYRYRNIVSVVSCTSATSADATLTINALPVVTLSVAPYTKLLPGLTTTITATSSPAGGTNVYQWYNNGILVAGATTNMLNVNVDGLGMYTARATNALGCTSFLSAGLNITDSASTKLFISPNPTTGQFQIRYYSTPGNSLSRSVTIYDAKGVRLSSGSYIISKTYGQIDVNLLNAGKGIYWIELGDLNGRRIAVGRVVVL